MYIQTGSTQQQTILFHWSLLQQALLLSDPVVLIGGQTPVRDTTVTEPDFKYTLVVDASTAEGVGSEILDITLVNDFDCRKLT